MADDLIQNARNLRKNATEAEKLLWSRLRNRQLSDLKFKRQHTFPPYILDFFCEQHKLGIELDGGQHNDPVWQMSDHQRTLFLEGKGITVLRFWNNDVLSNIEGVLETIVNKIPSPQPSPKGEGVKRILIGEITTAHGIKGFVKVRAFVEDETLLEGGDVFTLESGDSKINLTLKSQMKGDWLAEVKDVADRNAAEALRGTKLYIDRDALPDADDHEYYIEDLKGLRVVDAAGKEIGTVTDVVNYGAGDLIDIKPASGDNFYLPFTDDTVLDVDFECGVITAELPEII